MFNYYLAKGTKGIISYHTQIDSIDSTTYKLQCPKHIQNIAISSLSNFTCNYVPKVWSWRICSRNDINCNCRTWYHKTYEHWNFIWRFPIQQRILPKRKSKRVDTKLLHYNIRKKWYCRTKLYWKTNF